MTFLPRTSYNAVYIVPCLQPDDDVVFQFQYSIQFQFHSEYCFTSIIMATQSGITVEAPGKPFILSSTIPRRTPSGKQALVKCIAVGLNPVYVKLPLISSVQSND